MWPPNSSDFGGLDVAPSRRGCLEAENLALADAVMGLRIERADLRRKHFLRHIGGADHDDAAVAAAGRQRQEQMMRIEPALDAPAECAVGENRRRFGVAQAHHAGEEIEVIAPWQIGEPFAGWIVAEALDQERADEAETDAAAAIRQLAQHKMRQKPRSHLDRVDIAARRHRPPAALLVPVAEQRAERGVVENLCWHYHNDLI